MQKYMQYTDGTYIAKGRRANAHASICVSLTFPTYPYLLNAFIILPAPQPGTIMYQ